MMITTTPKILTSLSLPASMILTQRRFISLDYAKFYNKANPLYWKIWSENGYIHPGMFHNQKSNTTELGPAINETNKWLLAKLQLSKFPENSGNENSSNLVVADLGCGNGSTLFWLEDQTKYNTSITFYGMDFGDVPLGNAMATKKEKGISKIDFHKVNLVDIDKNFKRETFSHAYSQSVLCHIAQREQVISGLSNVIKSNGVFVLDDFITQGEVGKQTQALIFPELWNIKKYCEILSKHGFIVEESTDRSPDLLTTYTILRDQAKKALEDNIFSNDTEKLLQALHTSWVGAVESIKEKELGWATFVCKKQI